MFKEIMKLFTKSGKRSLVLSAIFFALYGLSSSAMIVIVFFLLFKITKGNISNLYMYFTALAISVVFKGVCNMLADLEKHNAGFDIVQQIREKMIIKLKTFSLGFYTDERLGEISTVLHKDVDTMSMVAGHVWPRMIGDFLISAVVFVGLAVSDIRLAAVMAAGVLPALGFLALSLKRSEEKEHTNNSALADMVSLFTEYVRGIPVLKSFSNNKNLDISLAEKTEIFGMTSKAASAFKAKQLSIFAFLLDIAYLGLLITGGIFTLNGSITVLTFILFAVISKEFYKPFALMETHYMYYVSAADSYIRLGKILFAPSVADRQDGYIPSGNEISFEHVYFCYEKDSFLLSDICFNIKENTTTALVGESGGGKTTVTNLLLRFYDVEKGRITVGGTDIRDIPYDELLNRIGIVMQNVQLFNDTVEENIRVGKKGASEKEIIDACKKARIHDFIMTLPEGYKTHIGENGGLLSGGQRQRISIARAFLKNAPILILDEMTSNVDPVNESLIQDAVTELAKNRTVLVIAHRLKTIKNADNILVFKKGILTEKGTHAALIEKDGYYKTLWQAQEGK
ncbi:ABC transporter ATP-binding protein [Treponema pedis]|uniref:ABC transporter ATP-binding protein n=1 Tax=Treponema pedis TaxID=409322 RepID=UPI00041563DE|nr:ABC transporter ATP-binding protein [Treponema pedis]